VFVDELVDLDTACTGDEALSGDTTCGPLGGVPQLGELSGLTLAEVEKWAMCDINGGDGGSTSALNNATPGNPIVLGTLNPGQHMCISLRVLYPFYITDGEAQRAQSDRVTWRYKFNAAA
jgi:hypothetical protein